MTTAHAPRVVGLCGSLRAESRTRIALREVLGAAREGGARTDLLDLRSYDLPSLYGPAPDPDDEAALRAAVERADGVVLATPNYHGSYSGALKDALDHLGREELGGTTVGLLEVAGGEFPGAALCHLRDVCRTLDAWTLPVEVAVPRSRETVADGGIADEAVAERARRLGSAVARYAGVERYPDAVEAADPAAGSGAD